MKKRLNSPRICLFIFLCEAAATGIHAQDPHVHTEYLEKPKITRVYTDAMYVIDEPSQFLMVELRGHYPKRQLLKPSKDILLMISSVSRKAIYGNGSEITKKFTINADGERMGFDRPSYQLRKGGTLKGREVFFVEDYLLEIIGNIIGSTDDDRRAYENTLPRDAQITGGKGVTGLFMERIIVSLSHKRLVKMANAQKIELRLGDTTFGFTENHMNTIRDFARRLTP